MSEYELLRKENDPLKSLIGQSYNQKSRFEANKILSEIHYKAESRMIGKQVMCYAVENKEILGLGGSTMMKHKKTGKIISNLILDQFGEFLAGVFKLDDQLDQSPTLKDVGGTNRVVHVYAGVLTRLYNEQVLSNKGILVRVGSGNATPARSDFSIQTPFATAPESAAFLATSDPVYNSGLGNFKYIASISAGGSGTVNETVLTADWRSDTSGGDFQFALFRDIVSPAFPFTAGQSIPVEYTIQL